MVEFVSANPTGPMHVGHGRGAAYGATLGNLLEATGHEVYREYYVNDAGRQIDILAVSVYLRYLELCGEPVPFPSNGYRADTSCRWRRHCTRRRGDALKRPAADVAARRAARRAGRRQGQAHRWTDRKRAPRCWASQEFDSIVLFARDAMLADIRNDLEEFGVQFDIWYSERELNQRGAIERALDGAAQVRPRVHEGRRRMVQVHGIRRRRGPRGGARQRREDLLRLRHRLSLRQARSAATNC